MTDIRVTNPDGSVAIVADGFTYVTPLVVQCPDPITVTAEDDGGAVVTYAHPIMTGGVPPYTVEAIPVSGVVFPIGTTTVDVRVVDAEGTVVNCTFPVTILPQIIPPPPLAITTSVLPLAVAGNPYAAQVIATGGVEPRVLSIQSGSLPTGVTFNSDGLFGGTPTVTGSFPLTVRVTDALQTTATRNYTLQVIAQSAGHPYYTALISRSDLLYAFPLRSQAEIDSYDGQPVGNDVPTVYDPAMDALVQTIDASNTLGYGGSGDAQQKWLPVAIPANTTHLLTFDHLLNDGWYFFPDPDPNTVGAYIHAEKSYRWDLRPWTRANGSPGTQHWFTWKHFFSNSGHVFNEQPITNGAMYSLRLCNSSGAQFAISGTTITSEIIGPIVQPFYGQPDRWVRVWIYYDAANQQLSAWYADAVQGVQQRHAQIGWTFPGDLRIVRLEWDISAPGGDALNPVCKVWTRNVVVLASPSLTYATVQGLLSTTGL